MVVLDRCVAQCGAPFRSLSFATQTLPQSPLIRSHMNSMTAFQSTNLSVCQMPVVHPCTIRQTVDKLAVSGRRSSLSGSETACDTIISNFAWPSPGEETGSL